MADTIPESVNILHEAIKLQLQKSDDYQKF